jgi:glycosyltransferase involved in cell wall biosynthesis
LRRLDGGVVITISVIIPAWCEAERIAAAVHEARQLGDEVIVADAGSPDGTARLAAVHGARVIQADKSRGAQLRAGAAAASGELLVFVHADAQLAPGARAALLRRLRDHNVIGGNFLLEFDGDGLFARIFTIANDLRRRYLRVYYGDSVLFVRRDIYEELGGFQPFPIFEDYDFVRRLERRARQRGERTAYIREVSVRVSDRRFARAPVRTLASWALLHALYSIGGVHPTRIASLYKDVRRVAAERGFAGAAVAAKQHGASIEVDGRALGGPSAASDTSEA